ncbi:MAG: exonuclease SbcCD subunit D [Microbacterium sp.]|uniref:exonuclease SbcCD subunit D n=1 Tax=Microbacterium sp. TaxID=51671 RepID=UPI002728B01B|nr:exonuclease SbcCD subunit D [Microbacterium sp.]MDO8383318.1 exonuclease SbcCD subunit D [Microbacterium sp.]
MRILHTSDWHIGRSFHGHSTLAALAVVLAELVSQVAERGVDLVVVAGDVFDSATPAAGCYPLLTDTLAAIRAAGAEVVVTSGNHDSAARLGFQAPFAASAGIHILTRPDRVGVPVTVHDEHGPVHVYGIPFLEPSLVRHVWPDVALRTQEQTMGQAMRLVNDDRGERGGRSIAIAHCFAANVEATPGVEREIRQGTLDVVPLTTFDGPDYVALGHIHGRNELSARVRYAGAPLHYSFGEQHKPRGSWLIDLDAAGLAAVEWVPLAVPRRLVTITGALDDLLTDARFDAAADAWVCAQYTDSTPQRDPMRRLLARFPHCATVQHVPASVAEATERSYSARVREARDDRELISAFLAHVRQGQAADEAEAEILADVIVEGADQRTAADRTKDDERSRGGVLA